MEYELIRSGRRTLSIAVRDGGVQVRAPLRLPRAEIDGIVLSRADWIGEALERSRALSERRGGFVLDYGGTARYRGGQYPIAAVEGAGGFDGERFLLPPGLSPEQVKAACVQICRLLAKRHLTERTALYAPRMSVSPAAVKVSGAKTRWGSCSSKGTINFSWRLIMAGDSVIDYVVVHELAHLLEMNHSARFWAVVERALPDYQRRKAMLRDFQRRLACENWDFAR